MVRGWIASALIVAAGLLLIARPGPACGDEPDAASSGNAVAIDFGSQVLPVFRQHCAGCHGPELQEGGLRLDLSAAALTGGDSGPVIVPGDVGASLLFQLVAGTEEFGRVMPPEDEGRRLSGDEVAAIEKWIDAGAEWPTALDNEHVVSDEQPHWSLQPIARPETPEVQNPGWVRNGIDQFVLSRLEQAGLLLRTFLAH